MQFRDWLLNEMPINRFELIGDWGAKSAPRGWDKPSIGILTNDKGVQKIRNMWNRCPVQFDMFFVRQKDAKQHVETGAVSQEWIKEKLNFDIEPNEEAITVFFTQNIGDNKIPMTGWTIGHRLGHAFLRSGRINVGGNDAAGYAYWKFFETVESDITRIAQNVFGRQGKNRTSMGFGFVPNRGIMTKIAEAIGTMKSARDQNISRFGEFTHELFGQYVLQGGIKFNGIPRSIGTKYAWGNPISQYYSQSDEALKISNERLKIMENDYNNHIREILECAKGHIYVM